eukprot:superscaffoldBa00002745_g15165
MSSMSPEVALHRISPELRPLLCSVVRDGRVGLDSTNCLRVTDLKTGCTSLTPGPCCDRFKLHIPYAGETLKWDIIFNARYPELPPDFIFGEDAEFLPEPSELPHLVQWDAGNPECLLQLVKELIQQYHHYQCQRLRESSRLLFEYDSLLEDPDYGRNMEIYAGHKNSWTGEFSARFLLKLPVDFSNIPVYLLKFSFHSLSPPTPPSSTACTLEALALWPFPAWPLVYLEHKGFGVDSSAGFGVDSSKVKVIFLFLYLHIFGESF